MRPDALHERHLSGRRPPALESGDPRRGGARRTAGYPGPPAQPGRGEARLHPGGPGVAPGGAGRAPRDRRLLPDDEAGSAVGVHRPGRVDAAHRPAGQDALRPRARDHGDPADRAGLRVGAVEALAALPRAAAGRPVGRRPGRVHRAGTPRAGQDVAPGRLDDPLHRAPARLPREAGGGGGAPVRGGRAVDRVPQLRNARRDVPDALPVPRVRRESPGWGVRARGAADHRRATPGSTAASIR